MAYVDVPKRTVRDARKWQRWSWSRRTLKRVMDPQRAREMEHASQYVTMIEAGFVPVPAATRGPQPGRLSWWLGKSL